MTQEEKELLLKDLCARLSYGVKAQIRRTSLNLNQPVILDLPIKGVINFASTDSVITVTENGDIVYDQISNCKPYLRPMSSMTEEEKKEEWELWDIVTKTRNDLHYLYTDFLISHHFDYRGLIEKGLAIEAPKDMYGN